MTAGLSSKTAREAMSKDIVSIHPQEHVHEALQLMAQNGLSMLPVVNGSDRCIGVLSQIDVVRLTSVVDVEDHDPIRDEQSVVNGPAKLSEVTNERIDEVMSDSVISVAPETPISEVAEVMLEHHVHHIPVVDVQERLLGIISTLDVLRCFR